MSIISPGEPVAKARETVGALPVWIYHSLLADFLLVALLVAVPTPLRLSTTM